MSAEPSPARPILVADVEPPLPHLLVRRLHQRGYRVFPAADGLEALRIYRSANPPIDLVLADVVMPGMNGMQLAAALLELDANARFILISAHVPSGTARLNSGVLVPVLQKPFNLDYVLDVLDRVLEPTAPPSPLAEQI